jgi:peptide/nickel transport system substrate-binding protein
VSSINPKFKVEPLGVQWPTYLSAQNNGFLPMFIIGWVADYPDPHNFISTYYASFGTYAGRQGKLFRDWAKENVDDEIIAAIKATDPAERVKLYRSVQEKAIEYALGVPLYMPVGLHVESPKVDGWYPQTARSGYYYYHLSKSE